MKSRRRVTVTGRAYADPEALQANSCGLLRALGYLGDGGAAAAGRFQASVILTERDRRDLAGLVRRPMPMNVGGDDREDDRALKYEPYHAYSSDDQEVPSTST